MAKDKCVTCGNLRSEMTESDKWMVIEAKSDRGTLFTYEVCSQVCLMATMLTANRLLLQGLNNSYLEMQHKLEELENGKRRKRSRAKKDRS